MKKKIYYIKIDTKTEEIEKWVDEKEIYQLLLDFGFIDENEKK